MASSPGGRYLAVAHSDNYVRFYHGFNYVKLGEYNVGFTINVLRFSNDGYYLAVGGASSSVTVINAYQSFGLNSTVNPGVGSVVVGVDFSNDSLKFVACGGSGTGAGKISLYTVSHTAAWTAVGTPATMNPASSSPNDCRISHLDGKIAVDIATKITIYDSSLANPVAWSATGTIYTKMAFDPLGTNLFVIDTSGNQFTNLVIATGATTTITGSAGILNAVDVTSTAKYIATGG